MPRPAQRREQLVRDHVVPGPAAQPGHQLAEQRVPDVGVVVLPARAQPQRIRAERLRGLPAQLRPGRHAGQVGADLGRAPPPRPPGADRGDHGRSGGAPVYAEHYDLFLEDVRAGVHLAKVFPLFILGHSFGGQLALALAARGEPSITGYLVSGPWLALSKPPAAWLIALASFANKVFPKCRFPN